MISRTSCEVRRRLPTTAARATGKAPNKSLAGRSALSGTAQSRRFAPACLVKPPTLVARDGVARQIQSPSRRRCLPHDVGRGAVKANGLKTPVTVWLAGGDWVLIDGRNCLEAMERAGVESWRCVEGIWHRKDASATLPRQIVAVASNAGVP
jgi:hypothetical protein